MSTDFDNDVIKFAWSVIWRIPGQSEHCYYSVVLFEILPFSFRFHIFLVFIFIFIYKGTIPDPFYVLRRSQKILNLHSFINNG